MIEKRAYRVGLILCLAFGVRTSAETAGTYRLFPDQRLQVILGLGFEIQADSIGSGNRDLPENTISVPHDLVPGERERFAKEMLAGFRYCRLAGGLYWRGLDPAGRQLRPRWPEQLVELKGLLDQAGVEGLSFEYWSPAPYWKANDSLVAREGAHERNVLRCFGPEFSSDPVYRGDVDGFLRDFSQAVVGDIRTLEAAGLKVSMWGLQNEPFATGGGYSKCFYSDAANYVRAYTRVAQAVRAHDASIMLISDTESNFPRKIAAGMNDPKVAALVDAYAVHTIGAPSESVRAVHEKIQASLPRKPWFQNEYEYLRGGATPERCLNTVQHIMDSFQLAGNPAWFWIHALKPFKNAEASGYSLGFWRPTGDAETRLSPDGLRRWLDGPEMTAFPEKFSSMEMILPARGDPSRPGAGYSFSVNQPVTLYLLADEIADPGLPGWEKTGGAVFSAGQRDAIYRKAVPKGEVSIPAHMGSRDGRYGAPHAVFIEASRPRSLSVMIGINAPIVIRSEYVKLAQAAARMAPGTWIYNRYNWNAVGSFVKRLPWNSAALQVHEDGYDKDARIFAFLRPDGRRTIVVSNRTGAARTFEIDTGLADAVWRGFRYTPDDGGVGTLGREIGQSTGARLRPVLQPLSWEFWEEQPQPSDR